MGIVFICGSHRSGSTSLLRMLQLSSETHCLMEPMPNLNIESRQLFEKWLYNPYRPILEHIAPRVAKGLAQRPCYIEKQNSLVPFIPYLYRYFGAKFVVPVRDGRDVVASLVNWHTQMYPIIYQECRDRCEYSQHARGILAAQKGPDEFDYSLPRPSVHDPWHDAWSGFTRFEMTAWYWNFVNQHLLTVAQEIPSDRLLFIDYTAPSVDLIRKVFDFIGLSDFDPRSVSALLDRRINSIADRGEQEGGFPRWPNWTAEMSQRFVELAWESFRDFGYAGGGHRPSPPSGLEAAAVDIDAFPLAAAVRRALAPATGLAEIESACVRPVRLAVDPCGLSTTHDIEALIQTVAADTADTVCLRASGYHPALVRHRHQWDPHRRTGSTRISPRAAEHQLRNLGFATIVVFPGRPADTGESDTIILATRDRRPRGQLLPPDLVDLRFRTYQAADSGISADQVLQNCNTACAYLSNPELGLMNEPVYFRSMLKDIKTLSNRRPGTMRHLALGRDRTNLALRMDVDMDVAAALALSDICREEGIPATFYLLHTAPYYGVLVNGAFARHEAIAGICRSLGSGGLEIGLHIDPYFFYLNHRIDGAQAVVAELGWLRSQGVRICGVTGHNCASVYGAESVEIFTRWAVRPGSFYYCNYQLAPIAQLNADMLGIEYEGGGLIPALDTDPTELDFVNRPPDGLLLRNPRWMKLYLLDNGYCRWGYDYNVWLIGCDQWVIAGREADHPVFEFGVAWARVVDLLRELDPGRQVSMTLHPCYFGHRTVAGAFPVRG